jgi:hypothetical protein
MSGTPETDEAAAVKSMRVPLVTYEFAQKLELQRDKARKERDQWRECAERLAEALWQESPSLNIFSQRHAALIEFEKLKIDASMGGAASVYLRKHL